MFFWLPDARDCLDTEEVQRALGLVGTFCSEVDLCRGGVKIELELLLLFCNAGMAVGI